MNTQQIIGYNLKKLREEKGIKQSALALQLSVSVQTLSAIENGKRDLKLSQLQQIASCLDISITDLLENRNEKILPEDKSTSTEKMSGVIDHNNNETSSGSDDLKNRQQKILSNQTEIKQMLEKIVGTILLSIYNISTSL